MFALSPPLMARNFEITIGSMWKQTRRRTVRLENWSQSLQFVATKPNGISQVGIGNIGN